MLSIAGAEKTVAQSGHFSLFPLLARDISAITITTIAIGARSSITVVVIKAALETRRFYGFPRSPVFRQVENPVEEASR